jgi:peptidyl-prolyl cis-trans isomerase C
MSVIKSTLVAALCLGVFVGANADEALQTNEPLLTYGENSIPLTAFEAYIDTAPPQGQYKLLKNPGRLRQVVTHLYLNRVLAKQALDNDLLNSPLEQARFENFKNEHLSALRMRQMRAEYSKLDASDLESIAKEYYLTHPDEFESPGKVHVSHILIHKSREKGIGVHQYALSVRDRVLKGEDFSTLATELSDDPSVEDNAGDLGVQSVDNLIPAFSKAAMALEEPGQISELIQTEYGYHVIQFHSKEAPGMLPWDEVKDALIERRRNKLVQQEVESYIESLKASKNYQINDAVLDKFVAEKLEQLQAALDALRKADKKVSE